MKKPIIKIIALIGAATLMTTSFALAGEAYGKSHYSEIPASNYIYNDIISDVEVSNSNEFYYVTDETTAYSYVTGKDKDPCKLFKYDLDTQEKTQISANFDALEGTYKLYQDSNGVYAVTSKGNIYQYNIETESFEKKYYIGTVYDNILYLNGNFYYTRFSNPITINRQNGEQYTIPAAFETIRLSTDTFTENKLKDTRVGEGYADVVANDKGLFILQFIHSDKGIDLKVTDHDNQNVEKVFTFDGYYQIGVDFADAIDNNQNLYVTLHSTEDYHHDKLYRINLNADSVELVQEVDKIGSVVSDGDNVYVSYSTECFDGTTYFQDSSYVERFDKNGVLVNSLTLKLKEMDERLTQFYESAYVDVRDAGYTLCNNPVKIAGIAGNKLILDFTEDKMGIFINIPFDSVVTLDKQTLKVD